MNDADPGRGRPSARADSGTPTPGDDDLDAALEALSAPGRLREAEQRVAALAPKLQRILATALQEGGWFDEAHRAEVLKAATKPDPDDRIAAVRTLLAEETRIAMMIGVTVGWELAGELEARIAAAGETPLEEGCAGEEPGEPGEEPGSGSGKGPGGDRADAPQRPGPRGTGTERRHD